MVYDALMPLPRKDSKGVRVMVSRSGDDDSDVDSQQDVDEDTKEHSESPETM